jgi:hypothetical protein
LNGNALFLRNFKGKVGKIRRGAPSKKENYARPLSTPPLLGGVKKCGYMNQLYYNGEDEYE